MDRIKTRQTTDHCRRRWDGHRPSMVLSLSCGATNQLECLRTQMELAPRVLESWRWLPIQDRWSVVNRNATAVYYSHVYDTGLNKHCYPCWECGNRSTKSWNQAMAFFYRKFSTSERETQICFQTMRKHKCSVVITRTSIKNWLHVLSCNILLATHNNWLATHREKN